VGTLEPHSQDVDDFPLVEAGNPHNPLASGAWEDELACWAQGEDRPESFVV
jgi:hypothetical protein